MRQWYNCPGCSRVIRHGINPCPHCNVVLDWRQQEPTLYLPSEDTQQRFTPVTKDEYILGKIQPDKQIKASTKKLNVVLILLSIFVVLVAINLNQSSQPPLPVAEQTPIPTPIRHDMSLDKIMSNSAYWNIPWQGKSGDLTNVARKINLQYLKTHTYIKNQTDCNDMAIDIWNMLWTEGIRSIIVAGNVDDPAPLYTLNQCNHAFLVIFHLERGNSVPWGMPLEPTNGECYSADDFKRNPQLDLYRRGFYYIQPSDLRADLGKNW
jgi:hypothetical protein